MNIIEEFKIIIIQKSYITIINKNYETSERKRVHLEQNIVSRLDVLEKMCSLLTPNIELKIFGRSVEIKMSDIKYEIKLFEFQYRQMNQKEEKQEFEELEWQTQTSKDAIVKGIQNINLKLE